MTLLEQVFFDGLIIAAPLIYLALIDKVKGGGKLLSGLGLFFREPKTEIKNAAWLFCALFLVSAALSTLLTIAGMNDLNLVQEKLGFLKNQPIYIFGYLIIVRVFSEEVFFRGFLAKKTGIWVSSAFFALAHFGYGSIAEILGAFVLGALLAHAYRANKNIIPGIFAHMAYNFMAIGWLM
ncbi:MAG: type II CAAX endopeptidase family protein [Candidatus Diapherotrites archaeon]